MKTRDIRTSGVDQHMSCDVCGRTLLRGERAHPYLEVGTRRMVCELCTARAVREGWVPEGTVLPVDGRDPASRRRRPLFRRRRREQAPDSSSAPVSADNQEPAVAPAPPRPRPAPTEPRHVRAIPSSPEHRMVAGVEAFNASEHPRTIAGIARSLGSPAVSIQAVDGSTAMVRILVAWELCWYRYEADLRDDSGAVRLEAQGAEVSELEPGELEVNAIADEAGALSLDA